MQMVGECDANSLNLQEHGDGRLLVFREPAHDPIKDIRAVKKRLTVGVFGGIQQALLDTTRLKVFDNTL